MVNNNFIYVIILLFLFSCQKQDDKTINIDITNARLVDNKASDTNDVLFRTIKEDGYIKVSFNSKEIKKNDSISYIRGEVVDDRITFSIITSPNNFDCSSDTCFTPHIVYFDMKDIFNKITYNIEIYINNGLLNKYSFKYQFN